jgi:hypothetical protein
MKIMSTRAIIGAIASSVAFGFLASASAHRPYKLPAA